eukprot:6463628-Alexandrium_andersonii.AAC.1
MGVRPNPSAAPLAIPACSASPELKAMVFWVVDQRLMARRPRTRTPPARGPPSQQSTWRSPRQRTCGEWPPRPATGSGRHTLDGRPGIGST